MAKGKIGLALGGGAARGWAHIGVLQVLQEHGIVPDVIAGTSIGAVVGGCYVADRMGALEDFARDLTRRRIFGFLDFNLAGSGLISGQRLGTKLEEHLGLTLIEDFKRRFVAVATELGTGHEVWLSRGRVIDALRASYAIPGIFKPISIHGRWLFDGALVNPIPVSVCRAYGARYVIAVNLNSDLPGRGAVVPELEALKDAPTSEGKPIKAKNGMAMRKLLQRQVLGREDAPGISSVMLDAFNIVQDRIARSRLAGDPPDVIVNPKLGSIGLFDFHRADETIARGRAAAMREIEDIVREVELRRQHPAHVDTHQIEPH